MWRRKGEEKRGFGTFLPSLKSNIRTVRGRISRWVPSLYHLVLRNLYRAAIYLALRYRAPRYKCNKTVQQGGDKSDSFRCRREDRITAGCAAFLLLERFKEKKIVMYIWVRFTTRARYLSVVSHKRPSKSARIHDDMIISNKSCVRKCVGKANWAHETYKFLLCYNNHHFRSTRKSHYSYLVFIW